jgi:hypothetical protein
MIPGRERLESFQGKGINCRGGLFLIMGFVIFIKGLKESWAIDKLGIIDISVEKMFSHREHSAA